MTTDDLTARIARILNNEGWTFEGIHEPGEYDECEECRLAVDPIAARIALEVTAEVRAAREVNAEVRAAKAAVLREAAAEIEGMGVEPWNALTPAIRVLRLRAAEYEAGGGVRGQYVAQRMHDGATRTHAEQEYRRLLADIKIADDRMGRGIHANGRDRETP